MKQLESFSLFEKLNIFGLLAVSFLMPISRILDSIAIIFFFLSWLPIGFQRFQLQEVPHKKFLFFILGLFFLHIIGLSYTSNLPVGLFDIQVKLSILILPVVLSTSNHLKPFKWFALKGFVLGCILTSFICLLQSIHKYLISGESRVFFYGEYSIWMHPTYLAMYCCFALSIIIYLIFLNGQHMVNRSIKFVWGLGGTFLLMVIGLLSSKTGIFNLSAIFFTTLLFFLFSRKYLKAFVVALICGTFFLVFVKLLPQSFLRLKQAQEVVFKDQPSHTSVTSTETTGLRILIWRVSLNIIKDNLLFGVGTGDSKDVLMEKYKENGVNGAYDTKLNAHNEFLNITVTLGLIGLLFLILTMYYPLWISLIQRDLLLLLLIIGLTINFITEAMLESQAGVVFFSFFLSLMVFSTSEVKHKRIL